MAARFRAYLEHLEAVGPAASVSVTALALQEGYNTGWGGTAAVVARRRDGPFTTGEMMASIMAAGVLAGRPMMLRLALDGGSLDGTLIRTWPCVVNGLRPYELGSSIAACNVELVDPVSFLAEQSIWGAYRSASAGEIVGGVLSLAAGGDGKPGLSPALPDLPSVTIVEGYRGELKQIPYAIAAGQTLGDWLAEFLAMLGLRVELSGSESGVLKLELLDSLPRRTSLAMTLGMPDGESAASPSTESGDGTESSDAEPIDAGRIVILGHSGFPGSPRRGALLDDPTMGSARPIVALGAVGTVLTGPGLDVEEASDRIYRSMKGTYAEMLMLSARSGQPLIRPGELVTLSETVHGLADWQVSGVMHSVQMGEYLNGITLIRGDVSWHPELPFHGPPVYVTAIVDGGPSFDIHEPVPRDRLGRIKISFPFTPTPTGEEAAEIAAADTNEDARVSLADFDDGQISSFTSNRTQWEEEAEKYRAGELDDPFPGKADDELTDEEKAKRDELHNRRDDALTYIAYERVKGDRDHDGVISDRDELISDELSEVLKDDEIDIRGLRNTRHRRSEEEEQLTWIREVRDDRRQRLEWLEFIEEGRSGANPDGIDALRKEIQELDQEIQEIENKHALLDENKSLMQEYGELFEDNPEDVSAEVLAARQDAEGKGDRWPPRIPLQVIKPMAGAMHGFIAAHRHGDICRVAVHSPLNAEIVGFQYRDDRKINVDLTGAVAGLVVEHNYSDSWSGLVFRRTDGTEAAVLPEIGDGSEDSGATEGTSSEGMAALSEALSHLQTAASEAGGLAITPSGSAPAGDGTSGTSGDGMPSDPLGTSGDGMPSDPLDTSGDGMPPDAPGTSGGDAPPDPLGTSGDGMPSDPLGTSGDGMPPDPLGTSGDGMPSDPLGTSGDGMPSDPLDTSGDGMPSDPLGTSGDGMPSDPFGTSGDGMPSDPFGASGLGD